MRKKLAIRLSDNLKRLLKQERASAATIANRLNINKSTLHNWENGVIPKSLVALVKLAEYFEVSLSSLVFESDGERILHHSVIDGRYEITIKKIYPRGKHE